MALILVGTFLLTNSISRTSLRLVTTIVIVTDALWSCFVQSRLLSVTFGWVGAQVTALGLVINLITEGAVSMTTGMVIGAAVVLAYTMVGGMWSVAMTDFVQMIVIVVGLVAILWFATDLAGGMDKVVDYARGRDLFHAFPEPTTTGWLF